MEPPGAPGSKRRRSENIMVGEALPWFMEGTKTASPQRTSHSQDPPPPLPDAGGERGGGGGGGGDDDGDDHISGLPDAILGVIISLVSTKEAARTQILASRWRYIWRATPLILDSADLTTKGLLVDEKVLAATSEALANKISQILFAHPGPGHRFRIQPHHLYERPATVDAWLRNQALNDLQELDFSGDGIYWYPPQFVTVPPPSSAFRFSATLRVATFTSCHLLDSSIEGLHFPHLKQLALKYVSISEASLNRMISNCPVLECLLLNYSFGFSCVRISSSSLRSIGVGAGRRSDNAQLHDFIIVDAPCLERLLFLQQFMGINITVIAAPKLETLGCLCDGSDPFRLLFGTTTIEGLKVVNLTTVVSNVKILAVRSWPINLDMVIDLMKCFPCLEKLYIKCYISGEMNRWRRKHRQLMKRFDIRLKTIVLQAYRATRAQVNFASFFLLNARKLELMTLEVGYRFGNEAFYAEQYEVLQMEKRASRTARLHFTTDKCQRDLHVSHVRDLAITDPFECRC